MIVGGAVRSGAIRSGAARAGIATRAQSSVHDGISYTAASGLVTLKAPGAAPSRVPLTTAFTFTGGNQSLYRAQNGLLVQSVTNTPRVEYDAGGSVLGLLMEASRTNLCLQSEVLDNAAYTKSNLTVSANAIAAPDGNTTADALVLSGGSTSHSFNQTFVKAASSLQYVYSGFVKASTITEFYAYICSDLTTTNGIRAFVNLAAGTISAPVAIGAGWTAGAGTITPYANGWYRFTITGTSDILLVATVFQVASSGGSQTVNSDGALWYSWGNQLEQASFASSYIPTTTVSVARTADVCTRTLGSEFSATAGSFIIAGRWGVVDSSTGQSAISFDDGTVNNRVNLLRPQGSSAARFNVTTATALQFTLDNAITDFATYKAAIAWAVNNFGYAYNGGAAQTSATGTIPTITLLELGHIASLSQANCHIRAFDYYPTRLDNATLQSRST